MRPERRSTTALSLFVFAVLLVSNSRAADVKMIDTAQLHSMVMDNAYRLEAGREKQFMVIDARTREEYEKAHILSAVSIPEQDFERSPELLPSDKGRPIVIYGGTNPAAGMKLADKAAATGYTNIAVYPEGFHLWKEKHLPTAPLEERAP